MAKEIIKSIIVNDQNELVIKLVGEGDASYQHVYREAAGVHWDEDLKAFKSTPMDEWSVSKWFNHIRNTAPAELELHDNVEWGNVPDTEIAIIMNMPR